MSVLIKNGNATTRHVATMKWGDWDGHLSLPHTDNQIVLITDHLIKLSIWDLIRWFAHKMYSLIILSIIPEYQSSTISLKYPYIGSFFGPILAQFEKFKLKKKCFSVAIYCIKSKQFW